jgi:hypothetical protein
MGDKEGVEMYCKLRSNECGDSLKAVITFVEVGKIETKTKTFNTHFCKYTIDLI